MPIKYDEAIKLCNTLLMVTRYYPELTPVFILIIYVCIDKCNVPQTL